MDCIFELNFIKTLNLPTKMDNQHLLDSPLKEKTYDPFSNPPDLKLASLHSKATSVGVVPRTDQLQFCACCDNIVNKSRLPICFNDSALIHLGVGYPLYYKIAKYFILIMIVIFFISDSAIYFLMTLKCELHNTCLTLFGIPIINISIAQQDNLDKTQIVNMLTSLGIFIIVVYLKTIINDEIRLLTNKQICPSMYTIMLQNVPIEIEESQLKDWIAKRFGEVPIMLNWAFDVNQLRNTYKEKQECVIEYNKISIRLRKYEERQRKNPNSILNEIKKEQKGEQQLQDKQKQLSIKIEKQKQILSSYNKMERQCKKIGTVFVTFQRVNLVNQIIYQYECSFFNSFMKNAFSFIKKSKLMLWEQVIVINKAPAPREVIWDNLGFSYVRSLIFEMFFALSMIMMLLAVRYVIIFFMNYSLTFRIQGEQTGKIITILKGIAMSIILIIINCLMRLVIKIFTYAKKYYSYTKCQASFCMYYSIFYIINACCLVYVVHGESPDDTKELLLTDIHLIMIANALSQPLFKLFDPIMWYRIFFRMYISKLKPEDNPYTQQYINKLWQGCQISNADNYQYITRVLYVTTWFASVAPVGVLFSIVGIILDYWISKWLLVRVYRIPETISEDIAKPSLMGLELLPLIYICGVLQFTYKVSTSENIFVFFLDFLHYGITTLVIMLSVVGYLLLCHNPVRPQISKTYSQAKYGFGCNYETTNPITRLKGDINYLYDVLKQSQNNFEGSKVVSDLLKLSRSSIDQFKQRRQEIYRIKLNMQSKISSQQVQCIQMPDLDELKSPLNGKPNK